MIYYEWEAHREINKYQATCEKFYLSQGYNQVTASQLAQQETKQAQRNVPGFWQLWWHYFNEEW